MSAKERKELERRSKAELIEMLLQQRKILEGNGKKEKTLEWAKYGSVHVAFKFYYLGWDMHGLAQQTDRLNTVEEHFFAALRTAKLVEPDTEKKYGLPTNVNFQRCGRTDVGVSAFSQVFSLTVRTLKPKTDPDHLNISLSSYMHKLNSLLPEKIRIYAAGIVPTEFSARFSCTERKYKYFFIKQDLCIKKMREAATLLKGNHDFRNFCKIDAANVLQFEREIRYVDIHAIEEQHEAGDKDTPRNSLFAFEVAGSGFLWHQVRCIVSILFMIGSGQEEVSIIETLLNVKKCPRKPLYALASELPLILWDCSFGDTTFEYADSVTRKVREVLVAQWKDLYIKQAMMQHIARALPIPPELPRKITGKRKHKQIMERQVGLSLEELVANLSTKRKECYQLKKQKLDRYEQSNEQ